MYELLQYLNKCEDNKFFRVPCEPQEFADIANTWIINPVNSQKICDQLNEILLGIKSASQRKDVCENVIHHTCKHFDLNTACTYCEIKKFESKY
jgi:hypothetical protein